MEDVEALKKDLSAAAWRGDEAIFAPSPAELGPGGGEKYREGEDCRGTERRGLGRKGMAARPMDFARSPTRALRGAPKRIARLPRLFPPSWQWQKLP